MDAFCQQYCVGVGAGGTFQPSGSFTSTATQIDRLVAVAADHPQGRLTLHIHGGLVDELSAREHAEQRLLPMLGNDLSQPAFLVWKTGFVETVRQNLDSIYNTMLFQRILRYVLRYAISTIAQAIGAKSVGRQIAESEVEAELATDHPFAELEREIENRADRSSILVPGLKGILESQLQQEVTQDQALAAALEAEDVEARDLLDRKHLGVPHKQAKGVGFLLKVASAIANVTYEVACRYYHRRNHTLHATVVEEILRYLYLGNFGSWVWGSMKQLAADMWRPNTGQAGVNAYVGSHLLKQLAKAQQERSDFKVDLIAHSAGAVVACEMLKSAATQFPGLQIRNLFLLAPGCTLQQFHDDVVTHPSRVERVVVYLLSDADETEDALLRPYGELLAAAYPSSLLYLVSGILEQRVDEHGSTVSYADAPLLGMQRFHREARSFEPTAYERSALEACDDYLYPSSGSPRVAVSNVPDPEPGFAAKATGHMELNDDPVAFQSMRHFLEM